MAARTKPKAATPGKPVPKAVHALARPGVCTIGYQERSQEEFLGLLIRNQITLVCDVRANPFSRKPGFSKRRLAEACEAAGIQYQHLPELGIPKEARKGVKTPEQYQALFERYAREMLPKQSAALERIHRWVKESYRVVLLCYERLPEECHRLRIAQALEKKYGKPFAAEHL